eukprot:GHVS01076597.1.p1 GENE.GHVS01076597.1~~GHVS01076597.1.p1  ORF type:complete len:199 (+),score=35.08 GHVS01076597.1:151-747(+)
MGVSGSSAADHPGSRWVLENILFLKPDNFLQSEEKEETLEDGSSSALLFVGSSRPRVRRFVPNSLYRQPLFRLPEFAVMLELQSSRRVCRLKVLSYEVVFCFTSGEEVRRISADKVEYFERQGLYVEAVFVVNAKKKKGGDDQASLRFVFEKRRDCDSFCESVKRFHGTPVKKIPFGRPIKLVVWGTCEGMWVRQPNE